MAGIPAGCSRHGNGAPGLSFIAARVPDVVARPHGRDGVVHLANCAHPCGPADQRDTLTSFRQARGLWA
jgi:hypothetical protein